MTASSPQPLAPPPPRIRLSLGVTGHREGNAAFAANRAEIETTLTAIFDAIDVAVAAEPPLLGPDSLAPTRLHSMLVDGLDQIASQQALARGWELVAPLPFGRALNAAINAHPESVEEARCLLTGTGECGAATRARARVIADLEEQARVFELADRDETIAALYLARLEEPTNVARAQAYSFQASERVALAAQVLIEQSDLIVAVWDGASTSFGSQSCSRVRASRGGACDIGNPANGGGCANQAHPDMLLRRSLRSRHHVVHRVLDHRR